MNFTKTRLREMFTLDYRSLALLRIGIGFTLLCDIIQRLEDIKAFYTDSGTLPRASLLSLWGGEWGLSLHTAFGIWPFEYVLFILAFIVAIALIAGYRTTLATIISFIFLISIQNRNPLILQGGDVIFRAVLFWCMFLPLGKYLSIDSIRKNIKLSSKNYFSTSTVAYTLQIVLFYFFTGFLKTGNEWITDGTAIYLALSLDQMTATFGYFLLRFPTFLKGLTFTTVYLELYGSLALVSPVWNGPVRTIAIFLFALLQIGINMSMHLGLFGMISIVITFGLLPSWFWDNCFSKIRNFFRYKNTQTGIIYYDQDCGFCTQMVFIVRRILWLPPGIKLLPAQQNPEIEKEMLQQNSWIFEDATGTHYYESAALRALLKVSPIFFWLAYLFYVPKFSTLADYCYKKIAHSRMMVCLPETNAPVVKSLQSKVITKSRNIFIVFMIGYMLCWNIQSIPGVPTFITGGWMHIADLTRIDQRFNMFAPYPLLDDGWYVIPGILTDGREVDIFKGGAPVSYTKPENVSVLYKNQRWQKYMMNLYQEDYSKYRLAYGQYLCRDWNRSHSGPDQLQTFKIIFMKERTLLNYEPPTVTPTTIWDHHCF